MSTATIEAVETTEYFLPPEEISKRLSLTRRQVISMARQGRLPAHPAGLGKKRIVWRFLWSEVRSALLNEKKRRADCFTHRQEPYN